MKPKELSYRWPAEWEPHAATWVSWPHNRDTWPDHFEPVPPQMARLVQTIADFEPVNVLAGDKDAMSSAETHVSDHPNVSLIDIATNDAWCRDHGPVFLQAPDGQPPALIDWEYNAWGGKYPPFDRDNVVPLQIAERLDYRRFVPGIVMEGGSIEGNGDGLLLTTEPCLLNPNRNPGLSREQIEGFLRDYLSVDKILWLAAGELAGDDTDSHIDQLARFVNRTTVVAPLEDDRDDTNHRPLQQSFEALQNMTDQSGHPLDVVALPMPRAKYVGQQRLPACYCNFYLANGVCVVPQFEDPADSEAVAILSDLLPDRQVIGLPALDLVFGLGAFHCLTQQQPVARNGSPSGKS